MTAEPRLSYRQLAADAGVHSTTIRRRWLAAGDERANMPAQAAGGCGPGAHTLKVSPSVTLRSLSCMPAARRSPTAHVRCARDTAVKVLRAAGAADSNVDASPDSLRFDDSATYEASSMSVTSISSCCLL